MHFLLSTLPEPTRRNYLEKLSVSIRFWREKGGCLSEETIAKLHRAGIRIEVGDKIVTIGGMVGKVVHVTGDKLTFETGEDRVRIEITKWAVSSNEGKGANKETSDSEESLGN